jgi:Glycosyl-4,4'-diaponeurosporenoate acyltransferase
LTGHPQATAKYLVIFTALTVVVGIGLGLTVSRPDRYPLIFAFSLTWLIMAFVAAMTGKIFVRLDPQRCRLAGWEREGRIYDRVGLGVVRWVLQYTPLGWLNPNIKVRSGWSDMDRLLRDMNAVEGVHIISAGVSLAVAALYTLAGQVIIGMWLVILTILFNVYPVMLQRWNRGRILRLQRIMLMRLAGKEAKEAHVTDGEGRTV